MTNVINKESENSFLLLEGIQNGFSMVVDFLKYCKNVIASDKKQHIPNNNDNSLLLNVLNIYADIMFENETMKEEFYLISQLHDILEYFFSKKIGIDNASFMIDLLESNLVFLNQKLKLMRSFSIRDDKFIEKYNIIFEKYQKIFAKHESIFYTEIYTSKPRHKKTLNSIYTIMKEDNLMKE
ncbi:MAG: hypothetical protein FWH29_05340 [Methanobrevibacter sp.]|nr:hypothetical protein [Methanobrevibacter sp.]